MSLLQTLISRSAQPSHNEVKTTMDILPVDEDDAYVSGFYRIVIGWLVLTLIIAVIAGIITI